MTTWLFLSFKIYEWIHDKHVDAYAHFAHLSNEKNKTAFWYQITTEWLVEHYCEIIHRWVRLSSLIHLKQQQNPICNEGTGKCVYLLFGALN